MRFTLDTVGKITWPADRLGRPLYPEGFKELAEKLERPDHPPGRDVRCIISVGMLTEGWDVKNVFLADGAPFASTADKNPTLTIMALAWRMADQMRHCARSMSR